MAHENLWAEMKAHSMKSKLLYLKVTIGDFLDIGNVAKFEQQMWDLFYSLLTPESAGKIRGINQSINKIVCTIEGTSPYYYADYDHSFRRECNYTNIGDPEFEDHDTYRVKRTENGYETYVKGENIKGYWGMIQEGEKRFLNKYKDLLASLHELLNAKDIFFKNDMVFIKDSYENFGYDILDYLDVHLKREKEEEQKLSMKKSEGDDK